MDDELLVEVAKIMPLENFFYVYAIVYTIAVKGSSPSMKNTLISLSVTLYLCVCACVSVSWGCMCVDSCGCAHAHLYSMLSQI